MSARRIMEWVLLLATAGLMVLLKWLHLGVTHYNLFLSILILWCLVAIVAFRLLESFDPYTPEP
jgi:hypothetical protein